MILMINEGERKHHYHQDLLNYITIIWLRLTFETNFNFVFEYFQKLLLHNNGLRIRKGGQEKVA